MEQLLQLVGSSRNLIFDHFSKLCRGNSSTITICQQQPAALHVTTDTHLWSHLVQFSYKGTFLRRCCRDNQTTHFICNNLIFPKIVPFMKQSRKNTAELDDRTVGRRKGAICMAGNEGSSQQYGPFV